MKRKKAPARSTRSADQPGSRKPQAIPASYATFLTEIKKRVQQAQLRAHMAVSRELVAL